MKTAPKPQISTTAVHVVGFESNKQITQIDPSTTMKQLRPLTLLLASSSAALPAWAHEGHGLAGAAHWHGTDVLGFIGVLALAAAVWFKGGE